ncbi:MAG: FeoB-associated Cys-rich membrane protein [Lachnospira sp.]
MGTFVVGTILVIIVAAIVYGMIKNRKKGKHSCGGDCGHCSGCH